MKIEELYNIKVLSKFYLNRYVKIVENIKENGKNKLICENHHILPQSLFPQYSNFREFPGNSLKVTPREHFILHWILSKAYGGSQLYAYNMMARAFSPTQNREYSITSSMYEKLKIEMSLSNPSKQKFVKEKISQKALKRWANPDFYEKNAKLLKSDTRRKEVSKHWKNYWNSEENRRNKSDQMKLICNDTDYKNKMSAKMTIICNNEDYKKKISESMKIYWSSDLGEEKRKIMSEKNKGEGNPFYGKKHTEETIKKITSKTIGSKRTVEQKIRLSESQKGKLRSDETKKRISLARTGKLRSDETKNKIGEKARERCQDTNYRKKISDAQKNRKRGKCAHCEKEMDICNLKKYHNEKCKFKLL